MMEPGRARPFCGDHAHVDGAINVPKPLQRPRVPIMVGGNGPNVTWRLAARYADELNLDGMTPERTADALPVIRERCEEIDRDPATLPVSVHVFWDHVAEPGANRVRRLDAYRRLGVKRVMAILEESARSDDALESFAADAGEAGAELD
jgi:alkanesulfonate monooxygenase SsuD/methylene tetrahydromethanopterin reductase-like flavin-dependent oxidoreductase (luciferase family)